MALRDKTSASKKNTLICVGTIESFGGLTYPKERADGTTSVYVYEKVKIRPASGSTKAQFNLMWNPAFFSPDTTGADIKRDFSEFLYAKNIASRKGPGGFLEGLCGTSDAYEALEQALEGLTDYSAENVHEVLEAFYAEQSEPFIYILKQERKKTGEQNAEGKDVYEAGDFYEVDSIQHLTEKNVKALAKQVVRNEEYRAKLKAAGKEEPVKMVFKFDPSDYGIDAELPQAAEPAWVG